MKKKIVQLMLGMGMGIIVAGSAIPCLATEAEVNAEASVDAPSDETTPEDAETETNTDGTDITESVLPETESTEETVSDFIEGSAVLSDYDYQEGELTEDGWKSEFLNMRFVPADGITMSIKDNDKLDEYYGRNGEDKKVANSEIVAKDSDSGFVQMTVEVNPNHENAKDILDRFKSNEKLELSSKNKEMNIGGRAFVTVSGVIDKERYLLGICTEQNNVVLAIKVKYKDSTARKALLSCFEAIEEPETEVTEPDKKASNTEDAKAEDITMPEEFEDNAVIEQAQKEDNKTEE